MVYRTDKKYIKDYNKVFDYKTNEWSDKPLISDMGKIVDERPIDVEQVSPYRRGLKLGIISGTKKSYARKDIATINYKKYDAIIRGLTPNQFKVWEHIKRFIYKDSITVKLNNNIVKDITGLTDDSNASKIIKRLIDVGLIIKSNRYKDLYSANPNIYFRGNYTKFAIDYINSGLNDTTNYHTDYDEVNK